MKITDKIKQNCEEILRLCNEDLRNELGEEEKENARCPKCGDEVQGDEDGLCANCV